MQPPLIFIGVPMDYALILASALFIYVIGSITRQMTTLLLLVVYVTTLVPDVSLAVYVTILHWVFFSLGKFLRVGVKV